MVFDLRTGYVPEVYSESRDYQVFLKLLGIVSTVFKYNIDTFPNLYSAQECPAALLPNLADMVGYTYKDTRLEDAQRKIIDFYPFLLRNRGSNQAMTIAAALSIAAARHKEDVEIQYDNIIVTYRASDGLITIIVPSDTIIRDLDIINDVRPVGTRLKIVYSKFRTITDVMRVVDDITGRTTHIYSAAKAKVANDTTELDSTTGVNFGIIEKEARNDDED